MHEAEFPEGEDPKLVIKGKEKRVVATCMGKWEAEGVTWNTSTVSEEIMGAGSREL